VTNYYEGGSTYDFKIIDNKVVVTYHAPAKDKNGNLLNNNVPRLWRIHAPDMVAEEIGLMPPASPNLSSLKSQPCSRRQTAIFLTVRTNTI